MAWDVDENGVMQLVDGNPVWVSETGEKKPVDYQAMSRRLPEVNTESKTRKEKLRALEERYALLADIEDLPAFLDEANKAVEMMRNAPDRDKAIEEQVKSRLDAMTQPLKAQIEARDKKLAEKEKALSETLARYNSAMVKTDVLNSKLLNERIKPEDRPFIQRELIRSGTVGDDGRVVYRFDDGERIYGENGDAATVDEAVLAILKRLGIDPAAKLISQSGASGTGAQPGGAHGTGGPKVMRRADFEKLDPVLKVQRMREGWTVTD